MPGSIDRIGKYEIQAELGEGAFGRVYRAYDPTVNRPVAIKVLTSEGKDLITRFRTEASAAGNLRHKNIVTIYEFGEHKGRPFIAMELLEGEDLSQVIAKREPFTLLQKMRIMSQAADGLHCAHSNGVLHRDVKPANIKLLPDGTVKILDFGIARVTRDRDATRLTQKGDLLGTILYMAPEQFSNAEVDRLCDIFAYGAIYYEFLSGIHPFASSDPRNAMFKITFEDPEPLRLLVPEIPEALEHIVVRALQKDRELRYQTLRDLLIDSKPILLELERESASSLLVIAKDLFARGELEAAEAKAIEIIDLDLGIHEAYEIREAVQKQLQIRIVQPRIQSLLRIAEEEMARKRFADAVVNYEAALRLDPPNAGIRDQLHNARKCLDRGRKVSRLVLEARVAIERGNLAEAAEKVASAVELEPEHGEAQRLLAQVDKEIATRREQQMRKAALLEIEALLAAKQPDAAIEKLERLASAGLSDDRVETLLKGAHSLRNELTRAKRRSEAMASVENLLAGRRFQEARKAAAEIALEFPEDGEIVALEGAAAAGIQAETVANVRARTQELSARAEFEEAVRTVESALRQYAADPELTQLLQEAIAARERHNRETAISAALDTARTERAAGRLPAAISGLDAALRQWVDEQRLVAMRTELQAEAEGQRRADEIKQICDAATQRIQTGHYADAIGGLQQGLERFSDDPQLRKLLVIAETEQKRYLRILEAAVAARGYLTAGNFDRAVQALEDALNVDADAGELQQLMAAARAGEQARVAKAIEDAVARCLRLRDDGSLAEALSVARSALTNFPGEQRLLTLRDEIQRELDAVREQRIRADNMAGEARAAERAGDYNRALDLWTRVGSLCPDFPNVDAEAQRVAGRIAEARRDGLLAEIEAAIAANAIARAAELSTKAEADFTGSSASQLRLVRTRVDAIAAANRLLDEGRRAFAERKYKDGAQKFGDAVRRLSAERQRVEQVVGELAKLGSTIVPSDWQAAQSILEVASKIDNSNAGVKELASCIERQRREEAIAAVLDRSKALEKSGDLAGAEKAIATALATYAGEGSLVGRQQELRAAIRDREARQRRAEAITAALDRSKALEKSGDLAGAEKAIATALATYADEGSLVGRQQELRAAIQDREARQRRAEAITAALDRSKALEKSGDLAGAEKAVATALATYAGEGSLVSRQQELRAAIQEREAQQRRAEVIAAALDRSKALEKSGDLAGAEKAIATALATYAGEGSLVSRQQELRATIQEREAQQRRAEAITAALDRSKALEKSGDLAGAEKAIASALATYAGEGSLVSRQQELRATIQDREARQRRAEAIAAALDRSKALEKSGDLAGAEKAIASALATYASEGLLVGRQQELRAAIQDREARQRRAEAITAALDRSKALEKSGDLAGAEKAIATALATYAGEGSLVSRQQELRATIQEREARQRRAEAITAALDRSKALEKSGDLAGAEKAIATALATYAGEGLLVGRQQELRATIQDREARQRRAEAITAALDRSKALEKSGDLAGAEKAIATALATYAGEGSLVSRQRELRAAIQEREAQQRRAEAITAALDRSKALEKSGDLAGAEKAIATALATYAGEGSLVSRQRELRAAIQEREAQQRRAEAITAALDRSKALEKSGDLAGAEKAIATALATYAGEGSLVSRQRELRGTIQEREAQQRRAEAIAAALDRSKALEKSGDLAGAEKAIATALATYAGEGSLVGRQRELRAAIQEREAQQRRAEAIAAALDRSKALEKSGNLAGAEKVIATALATYAGEGSLVGRQRELRAAIQEREAQQRRAEAIAAALDRSKALEKSGDLTGAEATVQAALVTYSGEGQLGARLLELRTAIAERKIAQREQALRVIEALESEAKVANANRLRQIKKQLDRISQQNADDADIQGAVAAGKREVDERIATLTRPKPKTAADPVMDAPKAEEQTAEAPASQPVGTQPTPFALPTGRNRVIATIAAAAAVTLVLIGWRTIRPGSTGAALIISSVLTGAEVTIGGKKCMTPVCTLNLRVGTYVLTARKDGYKPISESITIAPDQRNRKLSLTFEPLQQFLQVNTNFASGKVYIDGGLAGQLQDGQFIQSGITPGTHKLRVTGGDSEFQTEWKSATGEAPQLVGPINAKDLGAAILTNAGGSGALACNCDSQPVTVDGVPVGQTSRSGVAQLKGLAEGPRRIAIQGRSVVADIRSNPTLNVFLSSDRNIGTLVVETGQDNARVFVDNRPYRRLTEHGIARIQVNVGEHLVRVEREGYRSPAAQRVQVGKNEEKQVPLPLTPIPSILELANALPGAEVKVDGRSLGQVTQKGAFRTEVSPGDHRIELTKGDYTSAQFSAQFAPGKTVRPRAAEIAMNKVPAPTNNPPQADRAQVETREWDRVRNTNSAAELEGFLRTHPDGAHADTAKNLLTRLRQQEQQAAQENAARAADQNAWAATEPNRKASLENYVNRFGNGAHAQEARTLIAQIDKRELENLAKAAADRERADRERADRERADREGVMRALEAYATAFSNRDFDALKRIWPNAPPNIAMAFKAPKVIGTLTSNEKATISGDTATINCIRSIAQIYPGQPTPTRQTPVQVVLMRAGDSWKIQEIRE